MNEVQPAKVQGYWEDVAEEFDLIYSGDKGVFGRFLDRFFRKDMYDRLRLTVEECSVPEIRSVLDIGTGSGRFCIPLAESRDRVVGIDFSAPMIRLAERLAAEAGVADKCEFKVGDFMHLDLDGDFDAVLAIGVFDYVRDALPFLKRMAEASERKVIATFPTLWSWRVAPRWIRLNLRGCPVYFFTRRQIRELYARAGLEIVRFERVGKIYFVVAHP